MRAAEALARLTGADADEVRSFLRNAGGLIGAYRQGPIPFMRGVPSADKTKVNALFALVADAATPPNEKTIDGPEDVVSMMRPCLALEPVESFWVVCLDARARVTGVERVATGTLTACLVHPREVFAAAVKSRAASVIVLHNHPSGDCEPSTEDFVLTERLRQAGEVMGIPLVDHIVVASGGSRSAMR